MLLLIFSAASNESQHVLREVERAVSKNIPILSFRMDNATPSRSLEYFLYSNQWLDAHKDDSPEDNLTFQELSISIDTLVRIKNEAQNIPANKSSENTDHPVKEVHQPLQHGKFKMIYLLLGLIAVGVISIALILALRPRSSSNDANFSDRMTTSDSTSTQQITESSDEEINTDITPTKVLSAATSEESFTPVEDTPTSDEALPADNNSSPENLLESDLKDKPEQTEDTSVPPSPSEPVISALPEVGTYLYFGEYAPGNASDESKRQALTWQVLATNADQKTAKLITTKIIDLKPFDCAESGTFNKDLSGTSYDRNELQNYTNEQMTEFKGNNLWQESNIRSWLNSTGSVTYKDQPPIDQATDEYGNGYSLQQGFLSAFSSWELSHILKTETPVTDTEDYAYLLSVDEIDQLCQAGTLQPYASCTEAAAEADETSWYQTYVANGADAYIWATRTPAADNSYQVYIVNTELSKNRYELKNAASSGLGIRPCITVSLSDVTFDGDGTLNHPYKLVK